jgi:hypothetical protein
VGHTPVLAVLCWDVLARGGQSVLGVLARWQQCLQPAVRRDAVRELQRDGQHRSRHLHDLRGGDLLGGVGDLRILSVRHGPGLQRAERPGRAGVLARFCWHGDDYGGGDDAGDAVSHGAVVIGLDVEVLRHDGVPVALWVSCCQRGHGGVVRVHVRGGGGERDSNRVIIGSGLAGRKSAFARRHDDGDDAAHDCGT